MEAISTAPNSVGMVSIRTLNLTAEVKKMCPRITKKQSKKDVNNIQKVREAVKRAHDQIDDDMDPAARVDRAFNREMPFRFSEVSS